jgi:(1->4)-alpha-D-glucan 1-alpha-D-glucosylmutase
MMQRYRVPGATYRLQLNHEFTFVQATAILDYLRNLGITDVYSAPISRARAGSMHGYDVTNPQQINPEIGDADEFERFASALRDRRMGLLLDIVPNHMAASLESEWWLDLLAKGSGSPFARFFDVDWSPATGETRSRLLFPVLGKPYGDVLAAREIHLTVDEQGFSIRYFDHRFPMSAASLRLLAMWLRELVEGDATRELAALAAEEDPRAIAEGILAAAPMGSDERAALLGLAARINDGSNTVPSFAELDRLLDLQHYRLSFWRLASEELNYRRFFDISELAGLTVEERETFEAVHRLPLELARREIVTGLRIDHIDGLRDPIGYLRRLQDSLPGKRFYVTIEKILGLDEPVRQEFTTSGTTGYDSLNTINRVFVDARGLKRIDAVYRPFTDRPFSFENVVYRTKRLAIKRLLPGELIRLAMRLAGLAARDRIGRDIPFSDLRRALIEISACLPVYRTYIRDFAPAQLDRQLIDWAAGEARRLNPRVLHPAIDFVCRGLKLDVSEESEPQKEGWLDLVERWQQFTGPAMAKGFEDTALYRANRLISLNDVGSDPDPEPDRLTVKAFHRETAERAVRVPHTMNATSTHDTKRSEDARARINVLSEISARWIGSLERWHEMNREHVVRVADRDVPGPNEEWLIYQTLLGVWPLDEGELDSLSSRVEAYAIKAAREAKMHTSWLEPDSAWEKALVRFIRTITNAEKSPRFHEDFLGLERDVAFWGAANALAQVVLKAMIPGVPDFYQGTELWDFSLVDPDNRRAVDYETRIRYLAEIESAVAEGNLPRLCAELTNRWEDGRIKLYTTRRLLELRRRFADLFRDGAYVPLEAKGSKREHVVAFQRGSGETRVVVVVPRLVASLSSAKQFPLGDAAWGDTSVSLPSKPDRPLRDIFTGAASSAKSLRLAKVFAGFPVAVLASER